MDAFFFSCTWKFLQRDMNSVVVQVGPPLSRVFSRSSHNALPNHGQGKTRAGWQPWRAKEWMAFLTLSFNEVAAT